MKNIKVGKILEKIKLFLQNAKKKIAKIDVKKIDLKKINIKEIVTKIKDIDRKKIKKNFIWIALGILVVVFVLARTIGKLKQVIFGPKEEKKKMVEFMETVPIKVYKVKRMDFKDTLPIMGRIEGAREIDLKFDNKGILESFNFEEGERILEGDIIASLDQKDALLKLKYSTLELEKTKRLYELGGIEKMAVDQKKLEYDSAKRELEKTNIYAPSDGYLGSKEIDVGTFVTSQDKIGVFVDFNKVYAVFDVIEEDSPKMKLGQNAEVFLDAYPGSSYAGTVDMISPMIEGRTRTQKVRIELDNEKGDLKPGMFARAIVNTYEKKDALVIPASSFKKQENKYFVYIVHPEEEAEAEELKEETSKKAEEKVKAKEKGKKKTKAKKEPEKEPEEAVGAQMGIIEVREITIEYLTHDIAEISSGVNEGELVIREIHQEFKDKDKVEITEVQETIF